MTTLRVILDEVGRHDRTELSWYGEELTRALIAQAPAGLKVAAFTTALSDEREQRVRAALPGLASLEKALLPEREMREAWLHSITTLPLHGLVHATSLFAPLRNSEDAGGQMVVTVHADGPISDHGTGKDRWFDKAIKRAWKYADGIVVPTFALANQLGERYDFGGRVRVIAPGVPSGLRLAEGADAESRARALRLPERFVAVVTTHSSRRTGADLVAMLADTAMPDVPVVVVGPVSWGEETLSGMAVEAGIPPARFVPLGDLDDSDLALVLSRASALVHLKRNDAFALSVLAAFALDCPVAHVATPSLDEVSDGAALSVRATSDGDLSRPMGEAVRRLLEDDAYSRRLTTLGADRARLFHWTQSAEQVWQFHADL